MDIITKYFPNLTETQREQFTALYDLYLDWNSKINVISRKDITNLYENRKLLNNNCCTPGQHRKNCGLHLYPNQHMPGRRLPSPGSLTRHSNSHTRVASERGY